MCGKPATTDDHLPPKCVFPKPRPSNLITVRACEDCNGRSSLDDEYFRDFCWTGIDERKFPTAMALSIQKIDDLGTNPKKRGYGITSYKSLRYIDVITEAGLWIGKAPAREFDKDRINRVAAKLIYALHIHHYNSRIPEGFEVSIYHEHEMRDEGMRILMSVCDGTPPHRIGEGVFTYRFGRLITNATYLQDELIEALGLRLYFSPWQPRLFDWAFNLDRAALRAKWDRIPWPLDT